MLLYWDKQSPNFGGYLVSFNFARGWSVYSTTSGLHSTPNTQRTLVSIRRHSIRVAANKPLSVLNRRAYPNRSFAAADFLGSATRTPHTPNLQKLDKPQIMSSKYSIPSSPTFGFFPNSPTSPNAFSGFSIPRSPRDSHAMYAAFTSAAAGHPPSAPQSSQGSKGTFKNLLRRK
ncbi:hypothetical protein D9756_006095 [Leucocoprinus leucothites]|uniref:Uncharacterized protein n=1 Tax=Leucocoprinus leucothites TaxID=201217 RepID=A0A8H5D5D0_9AGAR|nr:hypothetical protein D9756_006095 [Leucoagaricus leucothites]